MLPDWTETRQLSNCRILYGGFSPDWAAGKLEREIVDIAAGYLIKKYPNEPVAVTVPSWYEQSDVLDWINSVSTTMTLVCSLTDPLDLIAWPNNVCLFGYTESGIKFDFWAVACQNFFKQYKQQDLLPTKFDFLFLNYNRKPHRHRVNLVKAFERAGIISLGCVTLGDTEYTVNDINQDYIDWGATDVGDDIGIPNDIYSLGQLNIWQRSFVNIVGETQFSNHSVFLSEKTFKPIIGLRPFIINGNPKIYEWLQQSGFDCFDDLFPVSKLIRSTNIEHTHKLIVDSVTNLKDYDLIGLYNKLLPRLLNNQQLFYNYAHNQIKYLGKLI